MKKLINILIVICNAIIIILSLAFIFIEGRLVFSWDWSIYDLFINAFIRYLMRLLIALSTGVFGIIDIISIKKGTGQMYLLCYNTFLVIFSVFAMIYTTNYVGIICLSLSLIVAILKLLKLKNKYLGGKLNERKTNIHYSN